MSFSHNDNLRGLYRLKCNRRYRYYLPIMSVSRASTIFGVSSLKIQTVWWHPWLIIELSVVVLGKTSLWQHRDYVLIMMVQGASTTFGHASWKMQVLRGDIELSSSYRPPFDAKMAPTTSLLCFKIERQRRVNDFWPCILERATVVRRHWLIIGLSAAILGENASSKIVTLSQNERQWSINNFWFWILDNLTAMGRR